MIFVIKSVIVVKVVGLRKIKECRLLEFKSRMLKEEDEGLIIFYYCVSFFFGDDFFK